MTPAAFKLALDNAWTEDSRSTTGAISLTTDVTRITVNTGVTYTLAAPVAGEVKVKRIVADVFTATTSTVTLTNPAGGTAMDVITFSAVGQSASLQYINSKWYVTALVGATVG